VEPRVVNAVLCMTDMDLGREKERTTLGSNML
jgi:hypothetical protein